MRVNLKLDLSILSNDISVSCSDYLFLTATKISLFND